MRQPVNIVIILLLLSLSLAGCATAGSPRDPANDMRLRIEKHVDDPDRRQKALDLMDDYMAEIQEAGPVSRELVNTWWEMNWDQSDNEEVLDELYDRFGEARKELRSDILDIHDRFRQILTKKEWKKIHIRSLIVLSEYYMEQEFGR